MYDTLFRQMHRSSTPVALCAQLMAQPRPKDNTAISSALAALKEAIARNGSGRALSAGRTLLVLAGPVKAIERMKRAGVLRMSSFEFYAPVLVKLVDDWLEHATNYGLGPPELLYLSSVANLCSLAPALRAMHRGLLSRLRAERITILKCLLAEVDASFVDPDAIDVGYEEERPVTREELAEAFSYLVGLFHSHIGVTAMQFGLTDPDAGYDPRYRTLLGDALKICRYREAEVLLEGFPYQANAVAQGVRVSSVDPALDRSIRLGYIQREVQSNVEQFRLQSARADGQIPSLPEQAEQYFEQLGTRVCRLQLHPVPRYVVHMPIDGKMAELFAQDAPFLEEVIGCASLALEEYLMLVEVTHQVVAGAITVMDLYKVQRLLRFMHHGMKRAIDRHQPFSERAGLYRASCLLVQPREHMLLTLRLAVGAEKASEVLALLTADLAAQRLDIQDSPVIAAGGYCMVSPAVLVSSKLPRNILSRLHKRLVPAAPDRPDPMQSQLAQALSAAGFLVVVECHLKGGKGNTLETDVLAFREGHLFVFECKNIYHPCNPYEMRNTYKAMVDASGQLSLRQTWLSDPANQNSLFSKLDWSVPEFAQVHTCIALGNRVLNGYNYDGHPVRQVHELLGLLRNGYIEFEDASRVRLWRSETMEACDLVDYLKGNTTHTDFAAAMVPIDVETPIGERWLVLSTYALDMMKLKETVLRRYPKASSKSARPDE